AARGVAPRAPLLYDYTDGPPSWTESGHWRGVRGAIGSRRRRARRHPRLGQIDHRADTDLVERLLAEAGLDERIQPGPLLAKQLRRLLVALVDDRADRGVDGALRRLAVASPAVAVEALTQEVAIGRCVERDQADLAAHAPARDHAPGDLGHL